MFWTQDTGALHKLLSPLSRQFFYAISSSKSSNVIVLLLAQIMVSCKNQRHLCIWKVPDVSYAFK